MIPVKVETEQCAGSAFLPALCKGLPQLTTLELVKLDDDTWSRRIRDTTSAILRAESGCPLEINLPGSPLSLSWTLFHPYPRQPTESDTLDRSFHFREMVDASAISYSSIKRFYCDAYVAEGLPPTSSWAVPQRIACLVI